MSTFLRSAIALVFLSSYGFSQTFLDKPLHNVTDQSLPAFLQKVEKQNPVKIFYLDEWLSDYAVDGQFNGYSLRQILDELLRRSDISYTFLFDYALIFSKDPAPVIEREAIINNAIVQRKTVERKTIGTRSAYQPGRMLALKGTVGDQDTSHPLEGAIIQFNNQQRVVTDPTGAFQFTVPGGTYALTFQHSGYDDKIIELDIYQDGILHTHLQETPILLEEVVISDEMVLDKAIGKTSLSISQIRRAPTFLGEVDVIKQIQTQPGVTTVGEIASGFNVRGGGVDQNLVLYDDVPVFNTSHALGFFTAFNSDAVGEVSFYRGGIPAQFGGRVSSVLNIVSRQGDFQKWTGSGSIGIISSHLTIGGPIKKDTTSVLISVRSSYSNWMLDAIKSNYEDLRHSSVRFLDGSLKLSHKLSERSKVTLSGYVSNDQFSLADDTTFYWSNLATSLRYDYTMSEKLFSSFSLSYGQYDFLLGETEPSTAFDMRYGISYPSLKMDFQLDGEHHLTFGFHNSFYRFDPGALKPRSPTSNVPSIKMDAEESLESALYVSDGFHLSEKLFFEAGLRFSAFNRFGPATVYRYNGPREIQNVQDSVVYHAGEISKSYYAAEPRISFRYNIGINTSFKLGYHRMVQYMHLITNTAAMTPTDIWQSSNAYFKPQVADQISAGIFQNLKDNMFEIFVEVYYKKVKNTLDFKDGANLILNRYLETALVAADGTAYGMEVSAMKVRGRLQGAVNYAYSRSLRQTKSVFQNERINQGLKYPANYDQPHVVNLSWRYGFSRRIFFSGSFVYHTGRPVSMPTSVYKIDGVPVSAFSERNQYRIPDYHRLDLAFIFEGNHKRKKILDGNWVFSFYNVYAKKNAYSVFFADNGEGFLKPYQLSVIGTIIPSVSYSFKF